MSTALNCAWRRRLAVAALALASGTTGWFLGQGGHDGREPASANGVATRVATVPWMSETRVLGATTEALGDSAVLGHVVVDDEATLVNGTSCDLGDEGPGVLDVARLERTLTEGIETERFAALTAALQSGFDLPPRLLQQTYVNDLAESVRLLAFEAYVDSISDDRGEVRATLESGVYDKSAAVQAESRRRLAELEQYERMLAEAPSQGP